MSTELKLYVICLYYFQTWEIDYLKFTKASISPNYMFHFSDKPLSKL